ncbi:MAG: 50S ribosome-binding GTPase [Candidatus Heimdallarchaeota archaeon]|nr:50S ribosome-binding GTPase [Candidatus Heimdallarchaeota archaeon]
MTKKGEYMSQGNPLESKVIVLGLSQSGKTSIRQVIFEGFTPQSTALNAATVRINRKLFNLAGGSINLFDIGGQTNYLDEVFQQYKNRTFTDVKAAIFVVDVSDAANIMRSKYYFDLTLKSLSSFSKPARIYIFAHKMDVMPLNRREAALASIADIFEIKKYENVSIHGTSIFDQTVWDAMQLVLSYVYPRDDAKTTEIKSIVGSYQLEFLALSTPQGLVLYSEPEIEAGVNYNRLKNELSKAYFPNLILDQAMFTFGEFKVFMREMEDDMVITSVFPLQQDIVKAQISFDSLCSKLNNIFKPDELLGKAKNKMRKTLADFLKNNKMKNVDELERKFDSKLSFKCDICGKQIQKSVLDIALDNAEQLERGMKITTGFGSSTVEIYPVHDCIEGVREIPVILDQNLEYRRYEKSRPI